MENQTMVSMKKAEEYMVQQIGLKLPILSDYEREIAVQIMKAMGGKVSVYRAKKILKYCSIMLNVATAPEVETS